MSNVIVEGFGTYGTSAVDGTAAVKNALLAGAYAQIHSVVLGSLPWDADNKDIWLSASSTGFYGARRVLPDSKSKVRVSFHFAVPELPDAAGTTRIILFSDSDNTDIGRLDLGTTGTLTFNYGEGSASTSGPVVVAEKDHHIELEIDAANQTFKAYVDGTKVLDVSSVTFTNTNNIAQFSICGASGIGPVDQYVTSIIVRDDDGDYNNTFPIGDRRVATLLVASDDADNQGWTAQPLHKFGVGILDLTDDDTAVYCEATTDTDIGANEYTIEG